jgi:hypothetical protein
MNLRLPILHKGLIFVLRSLAGKRLVPLTIPALLV